MNKKNIIQIPEAGHFLHYEKPDEIATELVKFLDDIDVKTKEEEEIVKELEEWEDCFF